MKFTDQIINVGYKVLLFVYIVFTCADEIVPVPKDLWGAGVRVRLVYFSAPECGHGATVGAKQLCVQKSAVCGMERQTGQHRKARSSQAPAAVPFPAVLVWLPLCC